jgi:hypothetical protein
LKMRRPNLAAFIAVALFAVPAIAQEVMVHNPGDWWHNYWNVTRRNNCWMEPFIYPDRASVCTINDLQVAKGWQAQNLLGEPHFEPNSEKLSPAGMIKLRWILTQVPAQYRNVFVQRGMTDEITSRRLAAAQMAAGEIARGGVPEVMVSDLPLNGTPASYVNGVNGGFDGYMQDITKPRPTAFQTESGSSGSP